MKRFLSVLATVVLLGQSVMTSVVYAQETTNPESAPEAAVETVVEESAPEADSADEAPANEEPAIEEVVAEPEVLEESAPAEEVADEPEVLEESAPAEEVADEPEVLDEEPATETPAEEGNLEESADVVEPVEEPEVPAVVEEPKAEEPAAPSEEATPVEEEVVEPEEKSALAAVVDSVFSNPLNGYVDGIYVTVEDPLGGLPVGVRMELAPVLEEHVFDLIDNSLDAKVTKVVAVDITFYDAEGNKVEPTQPINVKMVAGDMPEAQSVVHVEADYNEEKIEVGEANVEEIVADIDGNAAEFEAELFSIYAIVTYPVLTVNLYNNGVNNDPVVINVKNESEISSLIYDPGVENLGDKVFRGWIAENSGYTAADAESGLTIANIRTETLEKFGGLAAGGKATLNYYAMVFNQYTVTYYDERLAVIQTDEKLFTEEFGTKIPYTVGAQYTAEEGKNFMGRTPVKESEDIIYENGTGIILTSNLELYVSLHEGNWLIFNENGKGATYNAPRFVETDDLASTVMPTNNPERLGYVFGGWYRDKDCTAGNEFNSNAKLNSNTTIYAKWTANETAGYTVIIWKQNVDGDGYDFGEAIHLNGTVNTPITSVEQQGQDGNAYARVNEENKQYKGFHLKEFDQNVNIAPEGSSVLHVYYDRNEYTLTFQAQNVYTYTEANNDHDDYPQKYGTNDGINYFRVYSRSNNTVWSTSEYGIVNDNNRYNGTVYTRSGGGNTWTTVKEITALYETKINDEFPILGYENYIRKSQNSNTFGNLYIVNADIMPAENVVFHGENAGSAYKMEYYIQPTNLSTNYDDYELINTITAYNSNFHLTYEEDFMEMAGFIRAGSSPSFNSDNIIEHNGNGTMTVKFYYNRKVYPLNFMDGIYVDGDGKPVEERNRGQLKVVDNVSFGADLSSYNKDGGNYYKPEYNGFVFEGRYIDEACTHAYTFDKMPQGGVTVYAKWRQKQYRVFLHPNVPEDGLTIDWGTGQAMSFRVSNGGKVSVPEGRIKGYEFAGWYTDEDLKNSFYGDTPLNDTTVTTPYDKTVDMTDPMDEFGNIGSNPYNSDYIGYNGGDRFRITTKLDLYAKWRSTLEGATGMNIIYDANGGTNAPSDTSLYADQAEAFAQSASTPSDNTKQFKYWVVQKWNGNGFVDTKPEVKVYPGETFVVLKSYAKVEDITPEGSEETKMEYTVQLRAEYGTKEEAETTTIEYYNGGEEPLYIRTGNVNEGFTFEAAPQAKSGYIFSGWKASDGKLYQPGTTGYAADNVGVEDSKINRLDAVWDCDTNYHSEDEGVTCEPNKKETTCVTGTVANGYYVESGVTAEWIDGKWNIPACTEIQCNDHYTLSGGVCVLASHTLTINYVYAEDNSEAASGYIDTLNYGSGYEVLSPVITGYTADQLTVTGTMGDNDVEVTVQYTKDNSQTQPTSYTVNHVVEGETRDTKDYTGTAWINDNPAMIAIVEGSLAQNTYTGYKYVSTSIPEGTTGVVNGTTITLTYAKDGDRTKDLSYTVEYYKGTEKVEDDTITVTKSVWVNDTTNTLEVQPIDTGDNKYTGYSFDRIDHEPLPAVVESGTTIKVYYKINQYTITFDTKGGTTIDPITQNYDTDVIAPGDPTKTGYTFGGWDKTVPTKMPAENMTITAKWNSGTDTAYTVKHYFKGTGENAEYVIDYSKTQTLAGTTDTEVTANPLTEGIEGFEYNATKSAATISGIIVADGSLVLEVYYDRVESTITIDPNCDDEGSDACGEPIVTTGSYEKEITLPEGTRSYTLSYSVPAEAEKVDSQTVTATIIGYCRGESDECAESERKAPGTKVQIEAEDVVYTAVWSGDLKVKVADGRDYQTASTGYTFVTWMDVETPVAAGDTLTLSGNKTLVAEYSEKARMYTITFVDEDGTKLSSAEYPYGTASGDIVKPADPTKDATAQYTYTFAGWDPEIAEVTADATYTATYSQTVNEYTITWVDGDGNTLKTEQVAYGETPAYSGATPTKTATDQYTYTFNNTWDPAVVAVTTGATYTAQFDSTVNKYTVTWKNDDGTVLETDENVEYGTAPSYDSATPTKTGDVQYTYEFSGWTPATGAVTGDAIYTATYTATTNKYLITFIDENNTTTGNYEYGTMPTIPAFTKQADAGCVEYTGRWNPAVVAVVGEATYNAEYTCAEVATYTITWNNDDGKTLETDENVPYGSDPSYDGDTPTKTNTGYEYEFIGWTPATGAVVGDETYTATYDVACAENYHNKALETQDSDNTIEKPAGGEFTATALVCVSDTGEEKQCEARLPDNAEVVTGTYTPVWSNGAWSTEPEWALKGDECTYKCKAGYHVNGDKCEKDSTPGGGGGSGGGTYSCRNLPANAEENNDKVPGSSTSYTYDPESSAACTFHCKSGYHRDGQACVAGGGGGSDDEEIELGGQVSDKCSVEGSDRSPEEIAAYLYACENDITTIRDINEARLGDYLNRAEMAKIISVFATKELGMKPNTSKDCSNFAASMEGWSQEMKDFMVMSCQLELMGIHTVNYEAIPDFMPAKRVSRAEFGTILSRVLWGNKYEGTNENYYFRHLDALKANNIITNIDPNITEYRAWVLLMVYRAVEVIKSGNATPKTSVEEQVNEELKEEANAGTGTVVAVETGSVAEVETGSTAEVETGAVVEVETGAVAEVETGSIAD